MRFRELKLRQNPDCPVCGDNPTVQRLIDYEQFCGISKEEVQEESALSDWEIDPVNLERRINGGDPIVILDVREPHEYQICSLPDSVLIPLGDLPNRVSELSLSAEIVVHCKSGMRSAKAVDFLKKTGFQKVKNLKGGILAWSNEVDPTVPTY